MSMPAAGKRKSHDKEMSAAALLAVHSRHVDLLGVPPHPHRLILFRILALPCPHHQMMAEAVPMMLRSLGDCQTTIPFIGRQAEADEGHGGFEQGVEWLRPESTTVGLVSPQVQFGVPRCSSPFFVGSSLLCCVRLPS